jgi:hypothetical protein
MTSPHSSVGGGMSVLLDSARCIEVIREVRDAFLSEEYAVGQPLASFSERFASDQAIAAIEEEIAAVTLRASRGEARS